MYARVKLSSFKVRLFLFLLRTFGKVRFLSCRGRTFEFPYMRNFPSRKTFHRDGEFEFRIERLMQEELKDQRPQFLWIFQEETFGAIGDLISGEMLSFQNSGWIVFLRNGTRSSRRRIQPREVVYRVISMLGIVWNHLFELKVSGSRDIPLEMRHLAPYSKPVFQRLRTPETEVFQSCNMA